MPVTLHLACLRNYGLAAAAAGQWTLGASTAYLGRIIELSMRPGISSAIRNMYDRELRSKWERIAETNDPDFDINSAAKHIDEEVLAQCKRRAESYKGGSKGHGNHGSRDSAWKGKESKGKGKGKGGKGKDWSWSKRPREDAHDVQDTSKPQRDSKRAKK